MKRLASPLALLAALLLAAGCARPIAGRDAELARWQRQAGAVTIARDDWGIAHVRGRTDADAVFGMIYAQAEDDFNRIETNYLKSLGRLAEAEGERAIWHDLRARLFLDHDDLRARYAASPAWLRRLMIAWADGLNFYLRTHPDVRPRVLARFEPWMALSFSEGSIGGDVERTSLDRLAAFYGGEARAARAAAPDASGSNGIAIAPSISANGRALLLINPHTSFFFRDELQVTSGEGLNAYGAATWGQFFIYQGFNDWLGWMHTSSGVDTVDEFLETIVRRGDRVLYRYGGAERPLRLSTVPIAYRTPEGGRAERRFQVYHSHRGPIVGRAGERWISFAIMHRPVEALSQSFLRTKARDWPSYLRVMELRANSSNNTVYADADGNIALLLPQFVPRRDDRFDYRRPVDGADPATDWHGMHTLAELTSVVNPPSGWIQNTNNWPWSAAGPDSPRATAFPRYLDTAGENPRGLNALRLLSGSIGWTLERLQAAAYGRWLPAFDQLLPSLLHAYETLPESDPGRARLAAPVALLRGWDRHWALDSTATSLAIFWADALSRRLATRDVTAARVSVGELAGAPPGALLAALDEAVARLETDFGSWRVPWGEINRFQRLTGAINQPFSDAAPSLPVGFAAGRWGSLASFGAAPARGTPRWYGTLGNSFVAVVEFGPRPLARAITAGGVSGDPRSAHFNDQAARYVAGDLREVRFTPAEVAAHARRTYRPGD